MFKTVLRRPPGIGEQRFRSLAAGLSIFGLAIGLYACAGMQSSARAPGGGGKTLRIVFTEGVHGAMEPGGCGCRQRGGLSRRAALVSQLKSSAPAVLVLDAGNALVEKYPPEQASLQTQADYMLGAMEYMRTDAFNIGAADCAAGRAYLQDKQKKSGFPFVSANIRSADTNQPCFQPEIIRTIQGIRVGLFGLADNRRPDGLSTAGFVISSPLAEAERAVARLQEAGCALIILLSQLSPEANRQVARSAPGIHFILGSAAGNSAPEPPAVGDTVLFSAGENGTRVAVIDVELKDAGKPLISHGSLAELRDRISQLRLKAQKAAGSTEAEELAARRALLEERLAADERKNTYRLRLIPLDSTLREDPQMELLVEKYKAGLARERLSAAGAVYENRVPTVDLAGLSEIQQLIALRLMNDIACDAGGSVAAQAPRVLFCRELAGRVVEGVRRGEAEGRIRYGVLYEREKRAAMGNRQLLQMGTVPE